MRQAITGIMGVFILCLAIILATGLLKRGTTCNTPITALTLHPYGAAINRADASTAEINEKISKPDSPGSSWNGEDSPEKLKPIEKKSFIARKFNWVDPPRENRETVFHIPTAALKSEITKFGTTRAMGVSMFIQKRGFKVVGRRSYIRGGNIKEMIFTIVDYKQIFEQNLKHFPPLTTELRESAQLPPTADPLHTFLCFAQHITYRNPPRHYKGKFIANFFVPLVCLYEQYGDCDSKSLLLAVFLATAKSSGTGRSESPGDSEADSKTPLPPGEKLAMVLIRGGGLAHGLLAIKRPPLPGMTSLYFPRKGYYVVLETTKPGWAPGFIDRRVNDALKSGYFRFVELN